MAVAIATLLWGPQLFYCGEIIYDNIRIPAHRTYVNCQDARPYGFSLCRDSGFPSYLCSLLESLGRRSKSSALRSTVPWLPLVALTGLPLQSISRPTW